MQTMSMLIPVFDVEFDFMQLLQQMQLQGEMIKSSSCLQAADDYYTQFGQFRDLKWRKYPLPSTIHLSLLHT